MTSELDAAAGGVLTGAVAVVTGASRGAGRGIAAVLGERGATVYVTGRSVGGVPSAPGRVGTIEATADEVRRRGGSAVAVRCDHTVDAEVAALFTRVRDEHGRLDVLVNNAWGGYERPEGQDVPFFDAPFWQQPLERWDKMFTAGVRATYLTSSRAMPLLLAEPRDRPRLIVSTIAWAYGAYLGNVLYDTAKAAASRMAFGMARELRPHAWRRWRWRPAIWESTSRPSTWDARSPRSPPTRRSLTDRGKR